MCIKLISLRDVTKQFFISFPWSEELTDNAYQINRIIAQLDDLALGYEAKWGVGRLEYLATRTPPAPDGSGNLADKFQRQVDKLNNAITKGDVASVQELAEGFLRGYAKLEESAYALGEKPRDPLWFEYKVGSTIYRIVKNVADARAAHNPKEQNVRVMTGEELVKAFEKDVSRVFHDRVNGLDKNSPLPYFNFDKGDDIPV